MANVKDFLKITAGCASVVPAAAFVFLMGEAIVSLGKTDSDTSKAIDARHAYIEAKKEARKYKLDGNTVKFEEAIAKANRLDKQCDSLRNEVRNRKPLFMKGLDYIGEKVYK